MTDSKKNKHKRIPNSLRKYRKAAGLTQKEVAQRLGVKNTSLISRWERGFCVPKLRNALRLAILYQTMSEALFSSLRRSLQQEIQKAEQKVGQSKLADESAP
ncbi:MAG: helix-turn-helix transcriptional regulator [Deltaproteobacteria bacterium]|nr:helix-turn-helix transcriptional regulator [Deltaproteobacteria bacterium]